ncbi:MAG TPA: hypothetical protein VK943_01545 [Arenibaculum sp.]|nr:hypothetical protein [Arenibaculum sp.]
MTLPPITSQPPRPGSMLVAVPPNVKDLLDLDAGREVGSCHPLGRPRRIGRDD